MDEGNVMEAVMEAQTCIAVVWEAVKTDGKGNL